MEDKTLTVTQLSWRIKNLLEDKIGYVSVTGEISNFKPHSSGHRYFTLKDQEAQISCVMWKSRVLRHNIKDGDKVVITGGLTTYPMRGNYQLDCNTITPVGSGNLFLAFEKLKSKLQEQGYFDIERKRKLPRLPLSIGVATSPTGAAVRDIFTTLNRRFPGCSVYFRPAIVQGDEAPADIALAIRELNQTDSHLLIVGRGGGSLEDLWAFNTEEVADAIFNSRIPIISAVGHETDFTIADFVADVRAATPTAAAELATPYPAFTIYSELQNYADYFTKTAAGRLKEAAGAVKRASNRTGAREIKSMLSIRKQQVDDLENYISQLTNNFLSSKSEKLESLKSLCKNLHPYLPLDKGFALLKKDGDIVSAVDKLKAGDKIEILRKDSENLAEIIS